jgi:hypothetical protein
MLSELRKGSVAAIGGFNHSISGDGCNEILVESTESVQYISILVSSSRPQYGNTKFDKHLSINRSIVLHNLHKTVGPFV